MQTATTKSPGLRRAIERAGSVAALARALGISRASVNEWARVPTDRVKAVESFTGVPRHELRPDVFDAPA